jgi:dihydroxyacetone kinase-like protein
VTAGGPPSAAGSTGRGKECYDGELREEDEEVKTFYNEAERYVDEMLAGVVAAHPEELKFAAGEKRALMRADGPIEGKVAICTGGGSGHLPVFMGYVGRGLLDGAAIGNVFASPSMNQMLTLTRAVHGGRGVLYLYGNYGGDVMNFDMAAEMAGEEDIEVATVLAADDVASAPKGRESDRRGVAGLFYAYKVAGACADGGASLEEVTRTTEEALAQVRSIGVAITPCTVPGAGKPTFSLPEEQMEIGMGIHGEAGIRRGPRKAADEVTADMMDLLLADLPLRAGDTVSVLVNSLGATPLEELYIIYRKAAELLGARKVEVYRPYVGRYATSMEMAGFSLTLFRLNETFRGYLDHPVRTPFVREGR